MAIFNITTIITSKNKLRLLVIGVCLTAGLILLVLIFRRYSLSPSSQISSDRLIEPTMLPTWTLEPIDIEPPESEPDRYIDTLPDGTQVEYFTPRGPFNQERLDEFRSIIEKEIKK